MKRLLPLLLLLLVLTGCARQTGAVTVPGESTAISAFSAQDILQLKEDAVRPYTLLDAAVPMNGDICRINCDALTVVDYAQMYFFHDGLLFYEQTWDEDGSLLHLVLMDLKNGETVADTMLEVSGYITPQIIGDELIICDGHAGTIRYLDGDLQVTQEQTVTPDWNYWYLSPDKTKLYQLAFSSSARVTDLTSGTQTELAPSMEITMLDDSDYDRLTLQYIDLETQMSTMGALDLATGQITPAPFDAALSSVQQQNGLWVGREQGGSGVHYLYDGTSTWVIELDDYSSLHLLAPEGRLLTVDGQQHMNLYTTQGEWLAQAHPGTTDELYLDNQFLWSEVYGGYFMLASCAEGRILLFWEVTVPDGGGDGLEMCSWEEYRAPDIGTTVDASLYERAAQLGEEYGVTILIAEQCDTVFDSFESTHLTDEYWIDFALDNLEEALDSYPQGFFKQLRFDQVYYVEIQLVDRLTATDDEWGTAGYSAFASQQPGKYLVVMDSYQASTNNYFHEFSHIIDKKLSWDANCRADALYSEEYWRSLSPESADYSFTYTDWPDIGTDDLTHYFVDSYSRTYPTEDRARVMEYAMAGWLFELDSKPGIRAKLDYYCRCIRDSFDTETWPETTLWEMPLQTES